MKRGFTILEFLIYIAILSMAVAGISLVVSNIFRAGARTDVIQEVNHNGRFAMQRMGQMIGGASEIEVVDEGKGLSFLVEGSSTVFSVREEDGRKKLKMGDASLTTDKVNVDRLLFKAITDNSVRVEMIVSFYNPQDIPDYEFKSFFTTSFALGN